MAAGGWQWDVAAVIAVMGWLVSPIITLILPKILACLGFDAEQKLRELKIRIIPELENTLRDVDQARMMQRGEEPHVSRLDEMAGWLRHAQYDVEDIFDDAQEIESRRLTGAVETCVARCLGVITCIVRKGSALLMGWLMRISLCRWFRRRSEEEPAPVTVSVEASDEPVTIDIAAADDELDPVAARAAASDAEHVPVTSGVEALDDPNPVTGGTVASAAACSGHVFVPATSGCAASLNEPLRVDASSARWLSCLCSSINTSKNCCRSIFYWLVHAIDVARFYRDWSYEAVGIKSKKENATAFDFVLTAISKWNLKKRIEKHVENIVIEVKNSPLLGVPSNNTPNEIANKYNDIANKYRSHITTDSDKKIFGREELRNYIMERLRGRSQCAATSSSTSKCYSVIGIYGVAGSGKTTFARYTRDYIEEECKEEKLFDTIMCIHLSKTFSVDDIFHEMLKAVTKDSHSNISDHVDLKERLKESLRGKRFFLILDDLWVKNKNNPQLVELLSPLSVGMKGSIILVTARRIDSVRALCVDEPIKMPDLDEEEYFQMFMHYASVHNEEHYEELKQVGRVIAQKLNRSLIAAVTVAGRLGSNPEIHFWKSTAKDDMLNDTRGALWWSYQLLNPDIRRCFEFCNIFPRRFMLTRQELVRLWIAEGFIKTSSSEKAMEDVAEDYIQELVSCAFLQPAVHKWSPYDFTIHDLLHDLLDKVAGSDYFRIENEGRQRGGNKVWKGDVPRDVRHLFVQNYNGELTIEKILGLENLRTLIFYDVGKDTLVEEKVIESICKMLPKLRVLAIGLRYCEVRPKEFSFPESISQLKRLRYLQFMADGPCTITLPSTLNKLHHIQLLEFHNCQILGFTSAGLVNLRHPIRSLGDFPNIGRLRSLQTLPYFSVMNEEGYELTQLRDLNELRRLDIEGLENVKSKVEALEANLAAKERLTELSLAWDNYYVTRCSPEVESEVLEDLCPPVGLEKLIISGYNGSKYPNWMLDKQNGGPENLQELMFDDCGQRGPGPQLGAFPHLRKLELLNCSWVTLPANLEHLTSLKELTIYSCLNVEWLPTLPRSLEEFRVYSCYEGFSKSCQTVGHPNWQKIEYVPKKTIKQPIKEDVSGSTILSPSPPH